MDFFKKMKGTGKSPPIVSLSEIAWSWVGGFLGIAPVAYIHYNLLEGTDLLMIIGSFGASAVLIYGAVRSPLAQPRNLIGGHPGQVALHPRILMSSDYYTRGVPPDEQRVVGQFGRCT